MNTPLTPIKPQKKKNFFISYVKGFAILAAIFIHLVDWSNLALSKTGQLIKEIPSTAILLFIISLGSMVFIAYGQSDIKKATKRLWMRGVELLGVYFAYNLIKLFLFNFEKEPFYYQFINAHTMDWWHILTLKSFTVPLSVILTIAIFLFISPLFLILKKKTTASPYIIGALALILIMINHFTTVPDNVLNNFLYAKDNIMIPLALWFPAYLLGFLVAQTGYEKTKGRWVVFFSALTLGLGLINNFTGKSLLISQNQYPLQLYYITITFVWMYVLIYIFSWLEHIHRQGMYTFFAIIRLLGDHTLSLYITHWIIVDLTIWILAPNAKWIWLTILIYFILFLLWKQKEIINYRKEHELATNAKMT